MYKSRSTAQFTSPEIGAPYVTTEERERSVVLVLLVLLLMHCKYVLLGATDFKANYNAMFKSNAEICGFLWNFTVRKSSQSLYLKSL